MQYLQAYDLLKAGGKIAKYAEDASSDDCTPRNQLRQYSKELYVASNNVINSDLGWKKKRCSNDQFFL